MTELKEKQPPPPKKINKIKASSYRPKFQTT